MYLASFAKMLPGSPQDIFAGNKPLAAWVDGLKNTDLGKFTNTYFAEIEIFHFIGMFLIGASVILTCLRLIGVGIKEEPASVIEKNTRVFLHIGAIMAIGTGLMMGVGNSGKLWTSEIFTAKMIAMVAGLIVSYGVMVPVAQRDGVASPATRIGGIIALALWILSLAIFAVRPTANVGFFHMLWAGSLILFAALPKKMRWVFIVGLIALLVPWQILTHLVYNDQQEQYTTVNKAFMYLSGLWIFGLATANILGRGASSDSNAFGRMIGYVTILAWVTVGAGGRWIGLS
ncbi:MAG: DUF6644 family protein [Alphaproteobacteria bacterium]